MSPVVSVSSSPPADWDAYVAASGSECVYFRSRWVEFAGDVFGFRRYYLQARDTAGTLVGGLPLVRQQSPLFGRRLVSLPFLNYGGMLACDDAVRRSLLAEAAELGRSAGAKMVEIRERRPCSGIPCRTDKVTMLLPLPDTVGELARRLGSKLRSQVKRAERLQPEVAIGGAELVREFYTVFAPTMRDLGTPVYPRRFFEVLFDRCGADAAIVVIRVARRAAAAAVLVRHAGTMEVPWAASLRRYRADAVNMRLYWELLQRSIEVGCRQFDFGRSTIEAGTYRFKLQWGAEPVPLYWLYPGAAGDAPPRSAEGRVVRWAQAAWTRLPTPFANRLGPWVSPGLPW